MNEQDMVNELKAAIEEGMNTAKTMVAAAQDNYMDGATMIIGSVPHNTSDPFEALCQALALVARNFHLTGVMIANQKDTVPLEYPHIMMDLNTGQIAIMMAMPDENEPKPQVN